MKQDLVLQGRVEMEHGEIAEAALQFVSTQKKLAKAIDAWLSTKHNMGSTKIRYSKDDGGIMRAVVDVKKKIVEGKPVTKFSDDPKAQRTSSEGFVRKNLGIFKFLKETFQDYVKKGKKQLTFDEVSKLVKSDFPHMDDDRLSIYLHDKRMLNNVHFSKRDNLVKFA